MALQSSGTISLGDIATEFDDSTPNSLSEFYGVAAGIPASGVISVSDFYGASNRVVVNLTIAANTTAGYDVLTAATAAGYSAGITDVNLTIDSGVYVGSPSTGASYAITVSGFTSGDTVSIVNNGYILGRGGNGGNAATASGFGCTYAYGSAGTTAGRAIYTNFATSITNNQYIAGGGGGGGASACGAQQTFDKDGQPVYNYYDGGSGGGGAGYVAGAGGTYGAPGSSGTAFSGGAGGVGGTTGGAGGSLGSSGTTVYYSGGGAGYYIVGNSYVTWVSTGTRLGLAA